MHRIFLTVIALLLSLGAVTAQDHVLKRLNESPRHHEWVNIKYENRVIQAFLVFPEVKEKAPAVLVIHENRGLTDWVRGVADQLAEVGYIAIAPDLLSGMGPDGGKTSDFADRNAARDGIYKLTPEQVSADLNATFDYVTNLEACNGKVAVGGFCWGGSQTFRFATNNSDLKAAFVFYGRRPKEKEALEKIKCPVYGFYGGNDARVNATIPETVELMKALDKTYDPVTYEGAGHGFMRAGEAPDASEANKKARAEGWARWKKLLKEI